MVVLRIKIKACSVYKLKPWKIILAGNQLALSSEIDLMLFLFWFFEMKFSKVIRVIKNFGAGTKRPLGSF
jgi:hypothetical protein